MRSQGAGAIQAIDDDGLLATAIRHDCLLVLPHAVGDIVPHGEVVLRVYGVAAPPPVERLRGLFVIGEERTIEQDPAFALRILVDIAIRALSPAVNDPTTAVQVLGAIEDLLLVIGESDLHGRGELRDRDGTLRVRVETRRWEDMLALAPDGDPRVRRDRHAGDASNARAPRSPRGARPSRAPRGGRGPDRGTRVERGAECLGSGDTGVRDPAGPSGHRRRVALSGAGAGPHPGAAPLSPSGLPPQRAEIRVDQARLRHEPARTALPHPGFVPVPVVRGGQEHR